MTILANMQIRLMMKYEKFDVTINSFQSHNAMFCDVTRGNRI